MDFSPFPRATHPAPDGLVIVDKPAGWTSHDVVALTRRLAGTKKVGHAGTLDPDATGVLILGVGKATKLLHYLTSAGKAYAATVRFGAATNTDDAAGEYTSTPGATPADLTALPAAAERYRGEIMQVPCAVSAIKVNGQRAYKLAREGDAPNLTARPVTITALELGEGTPAALPDGTPVVDVPLTLECSSGTYVRALARDLGAELGVGAHLTALRRTRVGAFGLDSARSLEALAAAVTSAGTIPVQPLEAALRETFNALAVTEAQARALSYGQRVEEFEIPGPETARTAATKTFNLWVATADTGKVIGLVEPRANALKPVWVIHPA